MNRRNFFKTIGIPALALPFVKRLGLPKPEDFQSLQIIKSGRYGFDCVNFLLHCRIKLTCPYCNYSGEYELRSQFYDSELIDYLNPPNNQWHGKYQVEPCFKCNKTFDFIISKQCNWKEVDASVSQRKMFGYS